MKIELIGAEEVISKLSELTDIEWEVIQRKQADEMKMKSDAITPYRTGALRGSATFDNDEFGYTAPHAAHVNYGHRTRGGGYVDGQHFLEEVVNGQDQIYKDDVLNQLKGKAK